MAPGQKRKLALPSTLLNELSVQEPSSLNARGSGRSRQLSRKEQRKAQRVQKRQSRQRQPHTRHPHDRSIGVDKSRAQQPKQASSKTSRVASRQDTGDDESIEEGDYDEGGDDGLHFDTDSEAGDETGVEDEPPRESSKSTNKKLTKDDAEIAELERKLGIKGKKYLPKSFAEDGLDDLLEGLDGDDQGEGSLPRRKRKAEADQWLAQKRQKAQAAAAAAAAAISRGSGDNGLDGEESDEGSDFDDWDGAEDEVGEGEEEEEEGEEEEDDGDDDESGRGDEDDDGFEGFSENEEPETVRPKRENPYVAPTTNVAKYVPPSLRKQSQPSNEVEAQLRRRVQGLINRLTNDNMIGITKDFLALYDNNPRQTVTSTLVETVLALVCSPEKRPDSFFTMTAGFVAAIHRSAGTAASAYFIQQMVEAFSKHYEAASGDQSDSASKHLITLLAELYNMQVIGCNLIFDFVRLFLEHLSELDTELLLKIIQLCGPSLRREDAHALQDIVNRIKPANVKGVSVRTNFMIDEMKKLQSNKTKAVARNKDLADQRTQIKKRIGTLEGSRETQSLRIGLKDIQGADKEGKWWLVGASWAGKQADTAEDGKSSSKKQKSDAMEDDLMDDLDDGDDLGVPDLWELAKQQGFNTEVRQRIFVALHAATDYENADLLIRNLRLNKHQRKEIPEVIVRSAERQQAYNHFYTLVASRFCGLKELSFQFRRSLTVRFARMGEEIETGDQIEYEADEAEDYDMRWLYNAARMYGSLAASQSLKLADLIKYRNLMALQEKTHMFVEVMFLTVLQEARRDGLRDVLAGVDRDLGRGIQYFVRKRMRHTDLLKDKKEKRLLQKRCDEVDGILNGMLAEDPVR
ncbi:hypothetical protein DL770_001345 [Monosporascus sp. CRB-9-2]|nr:hypothetical protein DL770_001345 [Monosporascus sp. CRB-9-2]